MNFDVPLVDLSVVNGRGVKDEALQRIRSIVTVGPFIDGPEVTCFEERWAEYCGARYCVGVANGTDALELAIRGVFAQNEGAPLQLPALTFVATAEAAIRAGEEVELVDVDPATLLGGVPGIGLADIAVGLYGQMPGGGDWQGDSSVIDAAQMHGLSLNHADGMTASWSFYPTKNLGAWGDAGAVTTDDEGLAEGIREWARHGGAGRTGPGFNSRLDTIQAAVLIEKLNRLDEWVEMRRQACGSYSRRLGPHGLNLVGDWMTSACHLCVVRVPHRDRVRVEMGMLGIETGVHYGRALSEMPWLDPFRPDTDGADWERYNYSVAERAAAEVLSLPLWVGMPLSTIERVCNALCEAVELATKEAEG